jgi:hypothetical protein
MAAERRCVPATDRRSLRRRAVGGVFIWLAGTASVHADPHRPPVQAEVDALLGRLSASGCVFNRNGSWHSAVEAKTHLAGKLEYLERRGLVQTAEQFIERGASASSISGRPYLVKCGNAVPMESRKWLEAQLEDIRGRR